MEDIRAINPTKLFKVGQVVKCKTDMSEGDVRKNFDPPQNGTVVYVDRDFVTVIHEKGWAESFDRLAILDGTVKGDVVE